MDVLELREHRVTRRFDGNFPAEFHARTASLKAF